ncbi:hypothetical protein [Streptomyces sp. NPDC002537]
MRKTVRRLARIASVGVLALGAVPLALASTAHAATTAPQHCQRFLAGSDPILSDVASLAGLPLGSTPAGGLECAAATNGDSSVNFCASNLNLGAIAIGQAPENHICP